MTEQNKHGKLHKSKKQGPLIPVCIADLPVFSLIASPDDTLGEMMSELERNPKLPGILLMKGNEFVTVLPRQKIFERLGHMYGVELFLRKPVSNLQESLQSKPLVLQGHVRIEDAVVQALGRPHDKIYDPIVVVGEDESVGLLDMYVLFMAQSEILLSLSNTVGKLEKLEHIVRSDNFNKRTKLDKSLELLSQVVPYHQAAIYRKEKKKLELLAGRGMNFDTIVEREHHMEKNVFIHDLLKSTREPISIPDIHSVGVWQDLPGLKNPRSWLGTPIFDRDDIVGLLAIARVSFSPFSKSERDISQAFANHLAPIL
jgi:hypothetical protein